MDRTASTGKNTGIIIVRLLGGLGNQLFQYALGRHLSVIHGRPLKLDISAYRASAPNSRFAIRMYGLSHFGISAEIATAKEVAPFQKYLQKSLRSRILRRLQGLGDYYARSYIFEPVKNHFVFDPRFLRASLKPTVYLDGFWQSEKYFLPIAETIRREFTVSSPPEGENIKMIQYMQAQNSVALHIRHGDNATSLAKNHGVLPMDYYQKASGDLAGKASSLHYYIFSDDPAWAKENLRINAPTTFVTHNGDEKNYEDLRLMAYCKHHIIGNSTFSWWGAWLGKKPGQIVYAPKRYNMGTSAPVADLYPRAWNLVEI